VVDQPQPPGEAVPTRENLAHHFPEQIITVSLNLLPVRGK
jgi:hypothetical protein